MPLFAAPNRRRGIANNTLIKKEKTMTARAA
jgi:hypothetical protein